MEEIQRSPVEVGRFSHYLQGFIHPRWCRISAINSIINYHLIYLSLDQPLNEKKQFATPPKKNIAATCFWNIFTGREASLRNWLFQQLRRSCKMQWHYRVLPMNWTTLEDLWTTNKPHWHRWFNPKLLHFQVHPHEVFGEDNGKCTSKQHKCIYGGFLKWWYQRTMGFPAKNDHFGVLWGYHHFRKHPYKPRSNR